MFHPRHGIDIGLGVVTVRLRASTCGLHARHLAARLNLLIFPHLSAVEATPSVNSVFATSYRSCGRKLLR